MTERFEVLTGSEGMHRLFVEATKLSKLPEGIVVCTKHRIEDAKKVMKEAGLVVVLIQPDTGEHISLLRDNNIKRVVNYVHDPRELAMALDR